MNNHKKGLVLLLVLLTVIYQLIFHQGIENNYFMYATLIYAFYLTIKHYRDIL